MYKQIHVDLGKGFDGKELEKLLIDAAKDVGIKAESKDVYNEIFRLNPVRKEQTTYDTTKIRLKTKKGKEYANMYIRKYNKLEEINIFHECSDKEIKKYLNAVSKRI